MSIRTSQLENGLRVVSHEMPHLHTVSLGVWVNAGARNEAVDQHGISHFLEHMAFKGTRRRNALQIAEEIESAGGDINAATGMETTAYFARVLKGDLPIALDVLSDILIEPMFDLREMERERQVICQEIGAALDAPDDLVFDLVQSCAYPEQPLGRPILGTIESVSGFSPDCIVGYRDSHYGAPSMVLSAAGAVDHDDLVRQAEDAFGRLPGHTAGQSAGGAYRGGFDCAEKPLEQTHVVLAFKAPGYTEDQFYALQVFSSVLGGGMSSRLFQEIREKRGLCYSIGSFTSAYKDTGLFGVYAATSPDLTSELLTVLTGELGVLSGNVGEDETARARAQLKAGLMMSLESSSMRADQVARQLLAFGRVLTVEEISGKVDAVDSAAVSGLADALLSGAKPAFAAVGALNQVASYDHIAAQFA
ncbi:MAG: M16 family metallopeptidase [Hyphomicrobiales bacterium]